MEGEFLEIGMQMFRPSGTSFGPSVVRYCVTTRYLYFSISAMIFPHTRSFSICPMKFPHVPDRYIRHGVDINTCRLFTTNIGIENPVMTLAPSIDP